MNALIEGFRMAFSGLMANKVRTALTMLGIVIGVTAVIALVSVGQGFSGFVTGQFDQMGTNVLFVSRSRQLDDPQPLTLADATALQDAAFSSSIQAVAPVYQASVTAVFGANSTDTSTTGVTPEYLSVRAYKMSVGRFITQEDVERRDRIVVLGYDLAQTLFPGESYPVGQIVRLNGIAFEVAGVLAEKGQSGPQNNDDIAMVPLTTAQTRLFRADAYRGDYTVNMINIQAKSKDVMDAAKADITTALRASHGLTSAELDDFQVTSQSDLLDTASSITGTLTLFLGAIAGISLLVGGIGIMNIMLVSVTERTREIGLRKALGAGRSDILMQFLIEAIALSLLGGMIGLGLGALAARLIGPMLSVQTVVSAGSAMLAVGFSATVGVLFGLYPAMRAARLHPIDALRYE